jgi:hypothetical protein
LGFNIRVWFCTLAWFPIHSTFYKGKQSSFIPGYETKFHGMKVLTRPCYVNRNWPLVNPEVQYNSFLLKQNSALEHPKSDLCTLCILATCVLCSEHNSKLHTYIQLLNVSSYK